MSKPNNPTLSGTVLFDADIPIMKLLDRIGASILSNPTDYQAYQDYFSAVQQVQG